MKTEDIIKMHEEIRRHNIIDKNSDVRIVHITEEALTDLLSEGG